MLKKILPAAHIYWPTAMWALFILALCAIPGQDLPSAWWLQLLSIDKLVHATLFFVLFALLYRNILFATGKTKHALLFGLLCCIVYGALLEVWQGAYFENRTADIFDFAANTTGALIALWCVITGRLT